MRVGKSAPTSKKEWQQWLANWQQAGVLSPKTTQGWQTLLTETLAKPVAQSLKQIEANKQQSECGQCGVCCRLASTEHDVATLQAMADAGDEFAKQFVSVMLPYENTDKARQRFPDLVVSVEKSTPEGQPIHFYHCPYVQENHKCGLWGSPKRPAMCATYPDTPLVWMQPDCGWADWKSESLTTTLQAHATLAVLDVLLSTLPSTA